MFNLLKLTLFILKLIKDKLFKAYSSGNQKAVDSLLDDLVINNAFNSYQFGNSEVAIESMEMMSQATDEELVALGLPQEKVGEFRNNIKAASDRTKEVLVF